MTNFVTKLGLGGLIAATALTAAAPADAQYRRWHRDRGGDVATGAIVGGIVGLGVGAAIASSNRDRYWDRGWRGRGGWDRGYYGPPRGYYNDRRFYRDRYWGPPRGYYRRGWDRGYGYGNGYAYRDPYYGW